ncbi:MAG: hypothetical protein A2600_12005 [Candidatus Lambdaproteobacteria bacterium RIFOXYD1_FULL_56_27]|uniref:Ketoreductase domain-containing protein n=1 Tax=Candidatus Lambdaproteobacteria bacterium RIFOXYD2_FULL_56_26 TaxID=1817773 RepID=A0A1F6GX46_9PROT|nr:MAG: hypothetical protein A2426_08870 [Candidatus Lambdaproteobacteria bacterium RIFOXYC1_FULL_56_13]OGH02708.1 MAG: hypothetical protein A2557_11540 [Candidatus Lambdaproteobacteria bacterium RIFOXYD2_FULL_56_26]OGH07971.1 MAG: hypothetical protein A2600_12005 [Candidatus Lambdaproteobacteria bacterium RIFOXYD1_FULL_56_27]
MKQVALITGASRGIGRAIALELAERMPVLLVYATRHREAEDAVKEITDKGGDALAFPCDISDFEQVKQLGRKIREQKMWVHTLINNAGILRDQMFSLLKEEDWKDVINVNLNGTFHCCKVFLQSMIARKSGVIVNISSVAAVIGQVGQANYCASKGGIIALTRSLAREVAPSGIRVNCVAPGYVESEMYQAAVNNPQISQLVQTTIQHFCPLRRAGKASEVAKVVSFLASPAASYLVGQTLNVDGGLSM